MFNLKKYLKKTKYNFTYFFKPKIELPKKTKKFIRKETKFQDFIYQNCRPNKNNLVDIAGNLKIFGKTTNNYILSKDIFSEFDFTNKKLKPAYFNIADVKVPYEASRLQYLQKAKSGVLNVNSFPLIYWNSPMDVAIRNINLIYHYFLIEGKLSAAELLNNDFELLNNYISQHYEFIKNNLEDSGNVVGNHYLLEVTSILLTIATFQFENNQNDYEYFHEELRKILKNQFYKDGTSFEGSSHYAAMVTEALILCKIAIEEIDFESELLPKIDNIIKSNRVFLSTLINDGELSQIGDNDSGRLFYFSFDEDNPLRMNWLIELIDSLYSNEEILTVEETFFKSINMNLPKFDSYRKIVHPPIKLFTKDFNSYCFNDFGLFVWRNEDEYLSIRCGLIGQNGIGGHSHYDQLSIECFAKNQWIARDPGTGTYTDDVETRNNFKSIGYHWGPNFELELPKEDEFDCFKLNFMSDGTTLTFNDHSFLGFAEFNGYKIYRKLSIENGIVAIEDFSKDLDLKKYTSWGETNEGIKVKFSNGYKRIS